MKSLLLKAPLMFLRARRNKRLGTTELKRLQDRKLRAIVKHSYENVAFYHYLFKEANLKPDCIKTTEDLDSIPILTKSVLRNLQLERFSAKNIDLTKCLMQSTSGTSGTPLRLYCEKVALLDAYLRGYRFQMGCGNKAWYRQVDVSAGWIPHGYPPQSLGLFKTLMIPAYNNISTIIQRIKKFKTSTLVTLPSFARIFCKEVRESGIEGINLRLIFTGGEMLDNYTRKISKEVIGAELFDGYGANEVGFISGECKLHTGLHVESDSCIVEITRNGEKVSPGEEGDITVTNLFNYASPLIRYNMEDIGKLHKENCSCGCSFPLMNITQGRKSDVFKTSDGAILPAVSISHSLVSIEGIKQFQVIQEKVNHFVVSVVKDNSYQYKTDKIIKAKLREVVGRADIEVHLQDEIPRGKSRKFTNFETRI